LPAIGVGSKGGVEFLSVFDSWQAVEKLLRGPILGGCGALRTTHTRALLAPNLDPLATFFNSLLEQIDL